MASVAGRIRLLRSAGSQAGCRTLTTTTARIQVGVFSSFAPARTFRYGSRSNNSSRTFLSWQFCSPFSTDSNSLGTEKEEGTEQADGAIVEQKNQVRLSRLLSQHSQSLAISRREAERLIRGGEVTVAGQYITSPHYLVDWDDLDAKTPGVVKVSGKAVKLVPTCKSTTSQDDSTANQDDDDVKVWIVHKLPGELVADHDPQGRPSMMERLMRGGVGKGKNRRYHLKPIGRLDMMTEGLILVSTCGKYAREMELPLHQFHRTYRVRVHGPLTQYKIQAMQRGMRMEDKDSGKVVRFAPMKIEVEGSSKRRATNCWIRMTCTEGKNRQIRNVLKHLGLSVTRLIRISFGDYQLQTIPPGMAIEVPKKDLKHQIHKGPLFPKRTNKKLQKQKHSEDEASPVQWVRHYR